MKKIGYIILVLFLHSCSNENSGEIMTSENISAIDPANDQLFSETLNSINGQKIEEVYYANVNYPERPYAFNGFHLCDKAVLIKFFNGEWLNWVWVEEGFYQTGEIVISTNDIRRKLSDKFTTVNNVSESKEWQTFIGKEISSIEFKTTDVHGNKHISDLKLTVANMDVTICAIEEPDPFKLPKLDELLYAANWTIVVFDDKILEKNSRFIK